MLHEQIVPYDITDSFFNIIEHSLENNYENILILEDDFIFDDKIKDKKIINEIKSFIIENKDDTFYFNLGPLPILFYPNLNLFNNIYRGYFDVGTQCVIYSKSIRKEIIKNKSIPILYYDIFLTNNFKHYFYKYPLCYQLYSNTNNSAYWNQNNIFWNSLLNILNLDKNPQPGYDILYYTIFVLHYIFFSIVIIYVIYLVYIKIFYFNYNFKIIK